MTSPSTRSAPTEATPVASEAPVHTVPLRNSVITTVWHLTRRKGLRNPNDSHPSSAWFRIKTVEPEDLTERSIAVVGSGVAGLTAAYVLSGRNRVTLFEADSRLGGHAHTHFIDRGDGDVI